MRTLRRGQPIASGVKQHDAAVEADIAANQQGWSSSINSHRQLKDAAIRLIGLGSCEYGTMREGTRPAVPSAQGREAERRKTRATRIPIRRCRALVRTAGK